MWDDEEEVKRSVSCKIADTMGKLRVRKPVENDNQTIPGYP
jgi:hypothetical protein